MPTLDSDTPARRRLVPLALSLCLGIASASITNAQSFEVGFDHLSTTDGLSQSTVNAILRDHKGFMWFGTQDGLNRFDGYSYTVFRQVHADSHSISDNYIWCLLQDREGNIWVGTLSGGLNCYLYAEDRFIRYKNNPADSSSLANNDVTALLEDSRGDLWIGTWGGGLQRYDRAHHRFIRQRLGDAASPDPGERQIRCIFEDRSGVLWIGTWGGLVAFNPASGSAVRYRHNEGDPRTIGSDRVSSLFEDANRNLWIGTFDHGLSVLDSTRSHFSSLRSILQRGPGMDGTGVIAICEDTRNFLWFGWSDAGVTLYNPMTGLFSPLRQDPTNPISVPSDRVYSLYHDGTGAIWVGTADAGVGHYHPERFKFRLFRGTPGNPDGLSQNVVRSILEDRRGDLWVGTAGGGLNRRPRGSGKFIHYHNRPDDPASLSGNSVMALFEDREGTVWIGTDGGGLNRYDHATGRFIRYPTRPGIAERGLAATSIMAIGQDRAGTLWVGTTGSGLYRYDRTRDRFNAVLAGKDEDGPKDNTSIWAIHEDSRGNLWLGTWGAGLLRRDGTTHRFARYRHDDARPSSLGNNTVWAIYEDHDGTLWFGTAGGGLSRLDAASGSFANFTEADGLPNNVVYGILPDHHGNLWLSTNDGLSRFTPALRTFKNFDEADGLQGNEFNQGAFSAGSDGTLYFGGINGFNAFHPDSIPTNPRIPPVVLTSFKVFDRPVPLEGSLSSIEEINISYREDFISFEFAALDYAAPGKNQYAYRMEGFDRDWVQCGSRRYAAYTGLPGGTYVFRVKGANSDGRWNETGAAVRIVVSPPFWRTWWFYLLAVSITGAAMIFLYRYRVTRLMEMERLRTRIASDLHDELASNLSSIALFSDLVHNASLAQGKLTADHTQLLDRITALAQESVAAIKEIIWAIDPKPETVYNLLLKLKDTMIPLCRAHDIRLRFQDPEHRSLPSQNLSPEQRKHLWLLLKEAVTNATRHAACTEMHLVYEYTGGVLKIAVEDNGAGFDPAEPSGGRGLNTMKTRAARLGGKLDFHSGPGEGTRITVTIPL